MKQVEQKNKQIIGVLVSALMAGSLILPATVTAQYNQPQSINPLTVDIKVCVEGNACVDNDSTHILDGTENNKKVMFTVVYKNNGNGVKSDGTRVVDLYNIAANVNLPTDRLTIQYGPGSIDKNTNKLTWTIDSLKSGESSTTYQISAVVSPKNETVTSNQQTAVAEGRVLDFYAKDTASYWINGGAKGSPATGDNELIAKTLLVLGSITAAFGIRKFVRGY